ncbi:MAG: hypothetical protein HZB32_00650 [Nitrospirae bacterium]|nr:hypothetical protein [Nitrospirota bacterium]
MYGQIVDPSGQPAPAVGMGILRESDGAVLANTVSDSNGAFVLAFSIPPALAGGSQQGLYKLYLSVNKRPILLPDLHEIGEGLYGPHTFIAERRPPKDMAGVAPRIRLIGKEDEILTAFKKVPHLFARPATARPPDPCSPYTQGEVPARVFYLSQLVMLPGAAQEDAVDARVRSYRASSLGYETPVLGKALRYGALLEFRQEWWDLGYALGDLLYSIPLAPCEETKIATVDWRRRDYARRQTALDERHFQDTTIHRNEMINETVSFIIPEKKITGTTEGGGGAISLGPLSGGYAKTVETVTEAAMTASTTASRYINDRIQQTSNTLRNTRSFAIAEVNQEEESTVRTRVLRNHNHCHTVTFQYFEVLRHYLLSTKLKNVRPAVFVPFQVLQFTPVLVSMYGYLLRRALLD